VFDSSKILLFSQTAKASGVKAQQGLAAGEDVLEGALEIAPTSDEFRTRVYLSKRNQTQLVHYNLIGIGHEVGFTHNKFFEGGEKIDSYLFLYIIICKSLPFAWQNTMPSFHSHPKKDDG
jgi:hypothetical protein